MVRFALALSLSLSMLVACRADSRPRCAECGMYADVAPAFAAGAVSREGRTLRFDAPRCLFKWLASPAGQGARGIWVTEHYAQRHVDVDSVMFVAGSDVIGPMGKDLIPVASTSVARFVDDHGGSVYERSAIDASVLQTLDR